jgi:hypothetical protein
MEQHAPSLPIYAAMLATRPAAQQHGSVDGIQLHAFVGLVNVITSQVYIFKDFTFAMDGYDRI